MTASELRERIRRGEWTAADPRVFRRPPAPPPEWVPYRQERLRVAVQCALMFLSGKGWQEILSNVGQRNLLGKQKVSRQRISQLVAKGTEYLLRHGCFVEVHPK